jgi:hypothetical protein
VVGAGRRERLGQTGIKGDNKKGVSLSSCTGKHELDILPKVFTSIF